MHRVDRDRIDSVAVGPEVKISDQILTVLGGVGSEDQMTVIVEDQRSAHQLIELNGVLAVHHVEFPFLLGHFVEGDEISEIRYDQNRCNLAYEYWNLFSK